MKNKLSLSIAILVSTFFSNCLFAANVIDVGDDDEKEGSSALNQPCTAAPKQTTVQDYTSLNHKNVNHIFNDIEDVEDDLERDVFAVNAKLVTTNDQSLPLLLGAVLQHKKTHEYHQYLITDTGLLSETTQPNAVKGAHEKHFHLIKATRGHVSLQLLEWLQVSQCYTVTALYTNRPVCRNCYLITHNLWEEKLKNNEKGCIGVTFPLLDKMPNLAQRYIKTHLNFPLVQNLVVPMMGYLSKEEMNKAIQQKDEQITMLSNEIKTKGNQLNDKKNTISTLTNQLKEKEQIIADFQKILQQIPKLPLDENTKEELFEAIKTNNEEKVKLLLEVYKDVVSARGKYQKTPFLCAAANGHLRLLKLFKNYGANINAVDSEGDNALHEACRMGRTETVEWLIKKCNLPLEAKGGLSVKITPFLFAASNGHLEVLKLLKRYGARIDAKDKWDRNALHKACEGGRTKTVEWLLNECNLPLEAKGGRFKNTPFLFAAASASDHLEVLKLLKEYGANVYAASEKGSNALHKVCQWCEIPEILKWFLDECNLPLEDKNDAQRTPFLCAASEGNFEAVKLLKERGANIYAKDKNGKTALDLAKRYKHFTNQELVSYLQSLGLS